MHLAVCDNDRNFLLEMEEILEQHPRTEEITLYQNMETCFSDMKEGRQFDVVLMDLDWETRQTGLDYAQQLYREHPHLPVIYITGYNDRFAQQILLHETNLIGYLVKPVDLDLLDRYLEKVLRSQLLNQNVNFMQQGRMYSIPSSQIIYIESSNHQALIHTQNGVYTVYEKLSSLMKRLPSCFVQCHKSFVVNMSWVQQMDANSLMVRDGTVLRISRSCSIQTRERLFSYLAQQI